VQTREEISTRIDALTAEDLWQTAREMFVPEELTMLIYK
jgi:predicted Zn-dependent peptidase